MEKEDMGNIIFIMLIALDCISLLTLIYALFNDQWIHTLIMAILFFIFIMWTSNIYKAE